MPAEFDPSNRGLHSGENPRPLMTDSIYATPEAVRGQLTTHLGRMGELFRYPSSLVEELSAHAREHLERHSEVMEVYLSDEFKAITTKAKKLSGHAQKGKIVCIDGRESRAIQDGKVMSRWSVPGGLVGLTEVENAEFIAAGRLVRSIREMAKHPDADLLEIMKVHTASHAPLEHGCAAIKGMVAEEHGGEIPDDPEILVRRGIELQHERENVLLETFNKARAKSGRPPVRRVTALGISDTDSLSFTLVDEHAGGIVNTRALLRELVHTAGDENLAVVRKEYRAANRQQSPFPHELSSIVPFEEANYEIARILMGNESLVRQVNQMLDDSVLENLTGAQRQALLYTMTRNMAIQYLTGIFEEDHPSHPFNRHNEDYASVSLDGIHVGDFEPGRQAIKASPGVSGDEAYKQVQTQLAVMEKHREGPNILYVVTAVPTGIEDDSALNNYRATNYIFFHDLLQDREVIAPAVKKGKLIPVPVLLDEDRRIIEVTDPLY